MIGYDYNKMVKKIRYQMKELGVNGRELAEKAAVGKSFVYDILRGKSTNPTAKKLMAIARVLNIPLSYLVSSENDAVEAKSIVEFTPIYFLEFSDNKIMNNDTLLYLPLKTDFALNTKTLRIYTIEGDSMKPTLFNKDFVLVDVSDTTPHPAGLFIINDIVGLSVRRIEYVRNMNKNINLRIVADNQKYSSYECNVEDINILGRVIWYARSLGK